MKSPLASPAALLFSRPEEPSAAAAMALKRDAPFTFAWSDHHRQRFLEDFGSGLNATERAILLGLDAEVFWRLYCQSINDNSDGEEHNNTVCSSLPIMSSSFEYITQGILLTTIACLGFLGNAMSVYVLLKPSVRGVFSNLLTALATFDALFLLSAILTFGLPALSEEYRSNVYFTILPFCFGLIHTFRVGSVYSTLSVTLERFFAIVFPFKDFDTAKKFLIPFTVSFAILYDVPKFFELDRSTDPESNMTVAVASSLRNDATYKLYNFWSKFLLIELIPYLLILILNSFILVKIIKSSKFRKQVIRSCTRFSPHHQAGGENPPFYGYRAGSSRASHLSTNGRLTTTTTTTATATVSSLENQRHLDQQTSALIGPNSSARRGPDMADPTSGSVSDDQMRNMEIQCQEHKLGCILIGISILFIVCQSFKLTPDIYEVFNCRLLELTDCSSPAYINNIVGLSHLLVCVNSSANFLMYLFGGEKFRRVWTETYVPTCVLKLAGCERALAIRRGQRSHRNRTAQRSLTFTAASTSARRLERSRTMVTSVFISTTPGSNSRASPPFNELQLSAIKQTPSAQLSEEAEKLQ